MRTGLGLLWACLLAAPLAAQGPLVSVLGVCSALTSNTYPLDSINWFDAGRHSQVIFYAHLLFPVDAPPAPLPGPWHPPMADPLSLLNRPAVPVRDEAYADAEWLDPEGKPIAHFGLTFSARIRSDWIQVNGADYIPHTFAMPIGTRELHGEAGQTRLPSQEGQYTVRFKVDGRTLGLAFFRMLKPTGMSVQAPAPTVPRPLSPSVQAR